MNISMQKVATHAKPNVAAPIATQLLYKPEKAGAVSTHCCGASISAMHCRDLTV